MDNREVLLEVKNVSKIYGDLHALKELNFQLGSDFLNDKEVLTIEDRIMANERIDFQRMREISEMIFRKENMSLIVIGPTKGITENKLRELL